MDERSKPSGQSHEALRALVGLKGACRKLSNVGEGNRNNYLNWVGFRPGREAIAAGVPRGQVEDRMWAAGLASGLSHGEVERTIRSSLSKPLPPVWRPRPFVLDTHPSAPPEEFQRLVHGLPPEDLFVIIFCGAALASTPDGFTDADFVQMVASFRAGMDAELARQSSCGNHG